MRVFLSYSSVDKRVARRVAKTLDEIGVAYFLDQKDVAWGDDVTERITKGLAECSGLVVIVSPASLKSQWVQFEVGHATALGKRIFPFLTHPSLTLPAYLQRFHFTSTLRDIKVHLKSIEQSFPPDGSDPDQGATESVDFDSNEEYKETVVAVSNSFSTLATALEVSEPISLARHLDLSIINLLKYAVDLNAEMAGFKIVEASLKWTDKEKDSFVFLCFVAMTRGFLLDRFVAKKDLSPDVLPELPEWKILTKRWYENVLLEDKWLHNWSDQYSRDLVDAQWSAIESEIPSGMEADDPRMPIWVDVLRVSVLQGMIARRFLMLGALPL